jgi:PAS domain S-box-containing protein
MKNSIGYQLFRRGLVLLLFILSMTIAGQICISLLKRTSNKVFTEYLELDALQEYRAKVNHLIIHLDNFILGDNLNNRKELEQSVTDCYLQLNVCKQVLTNRHDQTLFVFLENELIELDSLKSKLYAVAQTPDELIRIHKEIISLVTEGNEATENLLLETKIEINEFIQLNRTAVVHSTITIISLGILLLIIVTIGGLIFIKKLTRPISKLLASTEKISKGKLKETVVINEDNEFKVLAESFNSMIYTLEKTTVSRNYYNSILKNMTDSLIVTDSSGQILTVNQTAVDLLNYTIEELENSNIEKIFCDKDESAESDFTKDEIKKKTISSSERTFLTKDERQIPVLLSTSVMNDNNGEAFRHIFVAHDLTEKNEIERKLDMERKEKSIAINDAQEEEKFRIAIDLHDGLGQILTATSYTFHNFFAELNIEHPEYKKNVDTIQSQLDAAINESKNIAHNLIPLALKDFGLLVAIENLIDQANQRSKIKFRFDAFNYTTRINEKLEKAIFRIFQEAINNIIKHSKAKNASFQINKYDHEIVIVIEDDGIGFDLSKRKSPNKQSGIGLVGMRERITAFNGNFTIDTKPNAGTEILIEIPCLKYRYGKN